MTVAEAVSEPWISPGGAAILTTCGLILVALIAGIVELRKTRVSARKVEHEVSPNTGGSMRDAVDRSVAASNAIGTKLDKISDQMHELDRRLTRVETRTEFISARQGEGSHDQ